MSCDTDDVNVSVSTMTEEELKQKHSKVVCVMLLEFIVQRS